MASSAPVQEVAGRFRLGKQIGKGGFGTVFKAFDGQTGWIVAIKRISLAKVTPEGFKEIQDEVKLLHGLEHDNIVRYIDVATEGGHFYIVLEFVEGGSLLSMVDSFGALSEPLTAVYVAQVLRGLNFLHSKGVVHRDIKAGNLLLTKSAVVKLADFGLAMSMRSQSSGVSTGIAAKASASAGVGASSAGMQGPNARKRAARRRRRAERGAAAEPAKEAGNEPDVAGSPYWLPPETIELKIGASSPSCDVWSLGCTVIELLTGKPPYFELSPLSAMFHIVQDTKSPAERVTSIELSATCKDFLSRCFKREPSERATTSELLMHPWILDPLRGGPRPGPGPRYADELGPMTAVLRAPAPALDSGTDTRGAESTSSTVDAPTSVTTAAGARAGAAHGSPDTSASGGGRTQTTAPDQGTMRVDLTPTQSPGTSRAATAQGTAGSGRRRTGAAALLKGRGSAASGAAQLPARRGGNSGAKGVKGVKGGKSDAQKRWSLAQGRGSSMQIIRDRRSRGEELTDLSAPAAVALRSGRRGSTSGIDGLQSPARSVIMALGGKASGAQGTTRERALSNASLQKQGDAERMRGTESMVPLSGAVGIQQPGGALDPALWDDMEISDSESELEFAPGTNLSASGARRTLAAGQGTNPEAKVPFAGAAANFDDALKMLAQDDDDDDEEDDDEEVKDYDEKEADDDDEDEEDGGGMKGLVATLKAATKAVGTRGVAMSNGTGTGTGTGVEAGPSQRRAVPPRLPPLRLNGLAEAETGDASGNSADASTRAGESSVLSGNGATNGSGSGKAARNRRGASGSHGRIPLPTPADLKSRLERRKFSFAPSAMRTRGGSGTAPSPVEQGRQSGASTGVGNIPSHDVLRAGSGPVGYSLGAGAGAGVPRGLHDLSKSVALAQLERAAQLQAFKGMYEDNVDADTSSEDGTSSLGASTTGGQSEDGVTQTDGVGEFPGAGEGPATAHVGGRVLRREKRNAISGMRMVTREDMKVWQVARNLGSLVKHLDAHLGGRGKAASSPRAESKDAQLTQTDGSHQNVSSSGSAGGVLPAVQSDKGLSAVARDAAEALRVLESADALRAFADRDGEDGNSDSDSISDAESSSNPDSSARRLQLPGSGADLDDDFSEFAGVGKLSLPGRFSKGQPAAASTKPMAVSSESSQQASNQPSMPSSQTSKKPSVSLARASKKPSVSLAKAPVHLPPLAFPSSSRKQQGSAAVTDLAARASDGEHAKKKKSGSPGKNDSALARLKRDAAKGRVPTSPSRGVPTVDAFEAALADESTAGEQPTPAGVGVVGRTNRAQSFGAGGSDSESDEDGDMAAMAALRSDAGKDRHKVTVRSRAGTQGEEHMFASTGGGGADIPVSLQFAGEDDAADEDWGDVAMAASAVSDDGRRSSGSSSLARRLSRVPESFAAKDVGRLNRIGTGTPTGTHRDTTWGVKQPSSVTVKKSGMQTRGAGPNGAKSTATARDALAAMAEDDGDDEDEDEDADDLPPLVGAAGAMSSIAKSVSKAIGTVMGSSSAALVQTSGNNSSGLHAAGGSDANDDIAGISGIQKFSAASLRSRLSKAQADRGGARGGGEAGRPRRLSIGIEAQVQAQDRAARVRIADSAAADGEGEMPSTQSGRRLAARARAVSREHRGPGRHDSGSTEGAEGGSSTGVGAGAGPRARSVHHRRRRSISVVKPRLQHQLPDGSVDSGASPRQSEPTVQEHDTSELRTTLANLAREGEKCFRELDDVKAEDVESIVDICIDLQDVFDEVCGLAAQSAEEEGKSESEVRRAVCKARGITASSIVRTVGLLPVLQRVLQQEAKLVSLLHPWAQLPQQGAGMPGISASPAASEREQVQGQLLECCECLASLLHVLFESMRDSVDVQELACVVGAVAPVGRMMDPVIPLSIRRQCAAIAHVLAHGKKGILQLLVASGGVAAFVRLLHPSQVRDPILSEFEKERLGQPVDAEAGLAREARRAKNAKIAEEAIESGADADAGADAVVAAQNSTGPTGAGPVVESIEDAVAVVMAGSGDMVRFGVTARQGKAVWLAAKAGSSSDSEFAALDTIVHQLDVDAPLCPTAGLSLDSIVESEATDQLLLQVGLRGLLRVFSLEREAITSNQLRHVIAAAGAISVLRSVIRSSSLYACNLLSSCIAAGALKSRKKKKKLVGRRAPAASARLPESMALAAARDGASTPPRHHAGGGIASGGAKRATAADQAPALAIGAMQPRRLQIMSARAETDGQEQGLLEAVGESIANRLPDADLRFLCVTADQFRYYRATKNIPGLRPVARGRRGQVATSGRFGSGMLSRSGHEQRESAPADLAPSPKSNASPRNGVRHSAAAESADRHPEGASDPLDSSAVTAICAAGAVARDIRRRRAAEQREPDWDQDFGDGDETPATRSLAPESSDARSLRFSEDRSDDDSDESDGWMPDVMRDVRASLPRRIRTAAIVTGSGTPLATPRSASLSAVAAAACNSARSASLSRSNSIWLKPQTLADAAATVKSASLRAKPQQAAKEAKFLWDRLPLPILRRVNSVLLELRLAVELVCQLASGDSRSKALLCDKDLLAALVGIVTPAPAALLHHPLYAYCVDKVVTSIRSLAEPKLVGSLQASGAIGALVRVLGMDGTLGSCPSAVVRVREADIAISPGLSPGAGGAADGRIDPQTGMVPAMDNGSSFEASHLWTNSLMALWTVLRYNHQGQQLAAQHGVVQVLAPFILEQSARWTFANKIMLDLPMSGPQARDRLWEGGGLELMLGLLSQDSWKVQAAQAIALWLSQDSRRVCKALLRPSAILALEDYFAGRSAVATQAGRSKSRFAASKGKSDSAAQLLAPLQSILRTYLPLAVRLSQSVRFVAAVFARLESGQDPLYLRSLLKMLTDLWEAAVDKRRFARLHDMEARLTPVAEGKMANQRDKGRLQLVGSAAANLLQEIQQVMSSD